MLRTYNRNHLGYFKHTVLCCESFFSVCYGLPFAGDDSNAHQCAEDKEEDGMDSCVDCWPHSEENPQCKSKKKKRKDKGLCNNQVSAHTL